MQASKSNTTISTSIAIFCCVCAGGITLHVHEVILPTMTWHRTKCLLPFAVVLGKNKQCCNLSRLLLLEMRCLYVCHGTYWSCGYIESHVLQLKGLHEGVQSILAAP